MRHENSPGNRSPRKVVALAVAGLVFFGCNSGKDGARETTLAPTTKMAATTTTAEAVTTTTIPEKFSGGCKPFLIYAQNRWDPVGAAVRSKPTPLSAKIGSFAGNEAIAVDGWVESDKTAYPNIVPPFNRKVFFHVSYPVDNQEAWVSFAGSRGDITIYDPYNIDGGLPAPTTPKCKGFYTP